MPGEWASALGQLRSVFVKNDEEFELLRAIDKSATNLEKDLQGTVSSITAKLVKLAAVDIAYVYVFDGDKFRFVLSTSGENVPLLSSEHLTEEELMFDGVEDGNLAPKVVHKSDYSSRLAELFQWSDSILYLPLYLTKAECFGLILLGSREQMEIDLLLDDNRMRDFLSTVSQQLSNLITLHHHVEHTELQGKLTLSFFEKALDPIKCFDELARQVPRFLPSFGALKIKPDPEVQILLYDTSEEVLRIVGSTGHELRVTRLSLDHSFCGRLIRNSDLPYRVGDPRVEPDYKDYLGSQKGKTMCHELAIPIKWNQCVIGVLNLESEVPDAFAKRHVQSMQDLCDPKGKPTIAPMVHALKESIFLADAQQMSMISALDKHLDHVSRVLRHGVATAASTVGTNLAILERETTDKSDLAQNVKLARDEFDKLVGYIDRYREDIRGFSRFMGRPIKDIIDRAITMISPRQLKRRNIDIEFDLGTDIVVYCSLLLTQHIYDLVNNAVVSVEERLSVNPNVHGRIKITVELEPDPPDGQEQQLNQRCRVTIWDNGKGVPPEVLAKVGQPEFTTRQDKGGTGFGIFAAKRYIEAAHGVWLKPESVQGEFFKVMFLLDVYNAAIHGRD